MLRCWVQFLGKELGVILSAQGARCCCNGTLRNKRWTLISPIFVEAKILFGFLLVIENMYNTNVGLEEKQSGIKAIFQVVG